MEADSSLEGGMSRLLAFGSWRNEWARVQGWGLREAAVDFQEISETGRRFSVPSLLSNCCQPSQSDPNARSTILLGRKPRHCRHSRCGRQKLLRSGRRPGRGHGSPPLQEPLASSPRHGSSIWRSLNGPKRDPGVRVSSDHLAPLWSGPRLSAHAQTPASSFPIGRLPAKAKVTSQSQSVVFFCFFFIN